MSQHSVVLDPVSKSSISRHDQRLEEILQSGPPPEPQTVNSFKQKAMGFCGSRAGLSVIASIVFCFALLLWRPSYIFKKNSDNERSFTEINYNVVLAIAIIGGLCVFFIPSLI
jgi:hypothetical protein